MATTVQGFQQAAGETALPAAKVGVGSRIASIDALRGLVMLFMLLDHVRETFLLYVQVGDPVDAASTDPSLFFTRITSTFCAPTFVALTGLSAFLYGQKHTKREVSWFLFSRGLFLMVLEVTLISFAWPTQDIVFPPSTLWLQVIWAIGLSMVVLSALIHLPRAVLLALGLGIVVLHNLLDPIYVGPESPFYYLWAQLHQRELIEIGAGVAAKISYPVLPWIGLMALGYCAGPLFGGSATPDERTRRLLLLGVGLILGFVAIRWLNFYGDKPWTYGETPLRTVMGFLALTKYPPSLLFLMPTVGVGCLLLALFEARNKSPILPHLAYFGGAPMFFYVLHLYLLKLLYNVAYAVFGSNKGELFGVDGVWVAWLIFVALVVPLYYPTRWFAELKQRRRDIWWLKYL
jgi:uncharacterized membrane protein